MPFSLDDIIKQTTAAQAEAKAQNEKRYAELIDLTTQSKRRNRGSIERARSTYEGRVGSVQDLLQNSGAQAQRDTLRRSNEGFAQTTQDLISRGLYNTTTYDAAKSDNARQLQDQFDNIREQTDTRQAGALQQTTGDLGNFYAGAVGLENQAVNPLAGVIERRTDAYPDLSAYTDLVKQLTQAQAGTGGRSQSTGNFSLGASKGGGGGGSRGGGGGGSSSSSFGGGGGGGGGGEYSSGGSGGGSGRYSAGGYGGGGGGSINAGRYDTNGLNPGMVLPGSTAYLGGRSIQSGAQGSGQAFQGAQGSGQAFQGGQDAASGLKPGNFIRTNFGDGSFTQAGQQNPYATPEQELTRVGNEKGQNFQTLGAADPKASGQSGGQASGRKEYFLRNDTSGRRPPPWAKIIPDLLDIFGAWYIV